MIKIINGVFGYNDGTCVTPKTPKDEPFEAPAEIEERLVKEGVAEFVGKSKEEKPAPAEDEAAEDDADSLEAFTKTQLIEKFNELGLEGNPNKMNKAQLIEAIENPVDEAPAEDEAAEDDGPDFGEDDGVAE